MLVVDTCILIDIADDDPQFGRRSAQCLATYLPDGLVISAISYVELAPVFDGSPRILETFLSGLGVEYDQGFGMVERSTAFSAWARYISSKRAGQASRRPVADALIGAMGMRHDGLITRNAKDFLAFYPDLPIVTP